MPRKYAVVLYYCRGNRYSVNALLASIDCSKLYDIYVIENLENIPKFLKYLENRYYRIVIGFSFSTYMLINNNFLDTIKLINKVKGDNVLSIAGGPHPTGDPLGTIRSLGFDVAVIGEGEETFYELVEAYFTNGDLFNVKGIVVSDNGEYRFTGRREPVDLDNYPPFPYWRYLVGPIEITRGCPYGCFFCQVSYMHGFKPRHRSVDNIAYYAGVLGRIGYRDLRFITPNGLGYGLTSRSREARLELLEELFNSLKRVIDKYGMKLFYGTFPSEVRPEHLSLEVAKILRRYVYNREIIIGAQTGSNELLKKINRGHSVEDVFNAVDNALKAGFKPCVDFIFGLPGEEKEDLLETMDVIRKLVVRKTRIHLHVFLPLPGSPYASKKPGSVPDWVRREIAKIIGRGFGYGQWVRQERLARRIWLLRERGVIMPRVWIANKPLNTL